MNRLQAELQRLYLPRPPAAVAAVTDAAQPPALIDPLDRARAMVLELKGPPSWEHLAPVWQGVQAELELPAPAIAVSGTDGLQLWFSLAEPIAVAQAHAFLECLRARYLPDVKSSRVVLMPAADSSVLRPQQHARLVPALQQQTDNWSAFVAQDLAPIFADAPWLDIAPNEDGQAALLRGLEVTPQAAFEAACERLGLGRLPSHPAATVAPVAPVASVAPVAPVAPVAQLAAAAMLEPRVDGPSPAPTVPAPAALGPKQFLLRIMNDDTVPLGLRIDAAKVLLQHSLDQ